MKMDQWRRSGITNSKYLCKKGQGGVFPLSKIEKRNLAVNDQVKESEMKKGVVFSRDQLALFHVLIHCEWRSRNRLPVRCYHDRKEHGCPPLIVFRHKFIVVLLQLLTGLGIAAPTS